eukprot:CAMPEP_0201282488 /NCGR_PEP_ID=MMETSP1317-20130820/5778_1 /ASSEMBLY_ACC=CAM_ASM_000770 /TAXON_ID=187299 /ORGANISM="Undescribed Undescribed, Strain Undescribed" /LENGTH=89 /DNA_ID=CAMNT_0047595293 /DNA_START=385 /DNA_END=657 /DNA_ORIENTATION=+
MALCTSSTGPGTKGSGRTGRCMAEASTCGRTARSTRDTSSMTKSPGRARGGLQTATYMKEASRMGRSMAEGSTSKPTVGNSKVFGKTEI